MHVSFGSVLRADGWMLRTRSGDSVRLIELLDEAVERAAAVIAERSELPEADRAGVARAVGIGAVTYADLSSARDKDYVFAWGFCENCPILADTTSSEERASRPALAALTSRALVLGLGLLGFEAPEKL